MTEPVNPGQREMLILYSRPELSSNVSETRLQAARKRGTDRSQDRMREGHAAVTEASVCPRNQTILRGGRAIGSIGPKTIRAETRAHQRGPSYSLAEQQGSAEVSSVDIDRTGESGEAGWQLHRWAGQRKTETDRGSALVKQVPLMLLVLSPGR